MCICWLCEPVRSSLALKSVSFGAVFLFLFSTFLFIIFFPPVVGTVVVATWRRRGANLGLWYRTEQQAGSSATSLSLASVTSPLDSILVYVATVHRL